MDWMLAIGVYVIVWWTLLFAILPFGVRSQHEMNSIVPGSDPGAPVRHRLGIKLLINTVIASVIWLALDIAYIRYVLPP